ncbi:MAG TPA: bifunctional UDP-N-acetylmuramoyl-tripeptide:D-alanyl-D-alanine ligase/alanine racemase [Microscillaceae bacterium]|nr:bifunctional UDP-N-acetylmuramoyl-tripeptide:D-alanyl-D-alanine ligase/alanine racemase [Microscillaceae bacterium]
MHTIQKIVEITQATPLKIHQPNQEIYHLLLDSRKLYHPTKALFFAINGEHHDGHDFVQELYQKGVRSFVIEQANFPIEQLPQANFLLVNNAIQALQKIAENHRQQFNFPVIGITGSNGKTVVKEWLAKLLTKHYRIVKSPKSYNSQIGVPLSVWQMHSRHNLAIFEAGVSAQGDMPPLQQVIRPSLGIFTNLGTAHDEGFDNHTQKLREKWQLFQGCEQIVACYEHLTNYPDLLQDKRLITWGQSTQANVRILAKQTLANQQVTKVTYTFQQQNNTLNIPFVDEASLENILHCLVVMLSLQIPFEDIQERVSRLRPISMRMELKRGVRNTYLIDDSYSNDLASLKIALDFMSTQDAQLQKVVILSDMLQSGMSPALLYQSIADLLSSKQIDQLIAVGSEFAKHQSYLQGLNTTFVETTEQLLSHPGLASLSQAVVLIKGARRFRFEQLVLQLQQKVHGTVLEIDLDALVHNLNYYRERLAPQTKIMVMVKAFAYGSGSAEVAHLLQFHRVDYLAVAYADEGVFLRENGITLPIMVMNPGEDTFDKLLQYDLEPELYSFRILKAFIQFLTDRRQSSRIHLKIDTGMHRLGFTPGEIPELLAVLSQQNDDTPSPLQLMEIASVFSHLAGADDAAHAAYSQQQITHFTQVATQIEDAIGYQVIKHILNSPGIVRFPEAHFNMVRLGIGLYGVEANQLEQDQLRVISRLKTTISQIKHLKTGETVGYGRKGVAKRPTKTATIAIGYADGFSRAFSNGVGKVLVNGVKVPVIGNVCMDMSMIDVTDVEVTEGDEVIIFNETLSIIELAQSTQTIPYEILTNISERVKRVFYLE